LALPPIEGLQGSVQIFCGSGQGDRKKQRRNAEAGRS
jgi:hypothetical protein